jgi:hypothetical protein
MIWSLFGRVSIRCSHDAFALRFRSDRMVWPLSITHQIQQTTPMP